MYCGFGFNIEVGDNFFSNNNCNFMDPGKITFGNDVFIGPNVTFCNDKFPKSKNKDFMLEGVIVRKGASIGANATILPGVEIGEGALIGAGAIVTKNVPAGAKVKGTL